MHPKDLLLEVFGAIVVCGISVAAVALFEAHPVAVAVTLTVPLLVGSFWLSRNWREGIWSYVRFLAALLGALALVIVNVLIYCGCI